MKKNILYFFLLLSFYGRAQTLESLRKEYYKLDTDSAACAKLNAKLSKLITSDNTIIGYKGAVSACMANHVKTRQQKIMFFNKGKEMLEQAISTDTANTELRFLRFTIQTGAPKALGYNRQISNDKSFILKNAGTMKDAGLKRSIAEFMAQSSYLTDGEKAKAKQIK